MNRYLTIDNETGGIGLEFSLLSSYLGVLNEKGKLVDELDLKLIPDDDIFILSQGGMKVNNIDIRNWDGIKYKNSKSIIYDFLAKNSGCEKDQRGIWQKTDNFKRLKVIGQSVNGDLASIHKYLISESSWDEFVAKIPLDTLLIAGFLRDSGLLNLRSLSLKSMAEYFELDTENLHNGKVDAILTAQLYFKLKELIKGDN